MSGRRTFGGLLGAISDRLQGRTRAPQGPPTDERAADRAPDAAQRLDDALAGLRERIPESERDGSEPSP
jgi:hypothetical protein